MKALGGTRDAIVNEKIQIIKKPTTKVIIGKDCPYLVDELAARRLHYFVAEDTCGFFSID